MKVYAISDMHGKLDGLDLDGADLVVVAGDFAIMKGRGVWHMNDQVLTGPVPGFFSIIRWKHV